MIYDVLVRSWNPILGKFGRVEERANTEPLTVAEADAMVEDLLPCVDTYRGQGQSIHSVRKSPL